MTDNSHYDMIDIAKGIGIILVVLGHSLVPHIRQTSPFAAFIWIFIYNFHMPLFFFLSGWLFEKGLPKYTSKGKFIINKFKFLMVPYFVFSILSYTLVFLLSQPEPLAHILQSSGYFPVGIKDAARQILLYNNHIDQHLWFVYALFIAFVLNICFPKAMKSKTMLVFLLMVNLSKLFINYYGIAAYVTRDLLFFSLARAIYRKKSIVLSSVPKILALSVIFLITNCVHCYFYTTKMPPGIWAVLIYMLRNICSVCAILLICTLSEFIQKKALSRPLKALGLYSYDIYLMHTPFLVAGLMGLLTTYTPLPYAPCCIAATAAGLVLPMVVSKFIIRKIPLLSVPLLGKSYKTANREKYPRTPDISN